MAPLALPCVTKDVITLHACARGNQFVFYLSVCGPVLMLHTEGMATFTALVKIYSTEYSCDVMQR